MESGSAGAAAERREVGSGSGGGGARPTEREYIIRSVVDLHSGSGVGGGGGYGGGALTTMRMGCLVTEAETFPATRSLRISLGFEQSEFR